MFTIVSANYIGFAATLMQSVAQHVPDAERFIVLSDVPHDFPDIDLSATVIPCDRLGIANIDGMKLWYSVIEFNTAVKPFAFLHLFETHGFDEACYIDPDILLFGPMTEVFGALRNYSCVLTPHMIDPLQDGKEPSDLTIMKSGVYNLGFLGLRNDKDGRRLAGWWAERCFTQCRVDIAGHMFTDQRWMDLAPVFVSRPFILRHPGYNVAYWNLLHRKVSRTRRGRWMVNGKRLVFFHFSGISPTDSKQFSKHQNRFGPENLGVVNELCDLYRARVLNNGWQKYNKVAYGFGCFADGRRIDEVMRHWVVRMIDAGNLNPKERLSFPSEFFDRPDEVAAEKGVVLTRYMHQLWLDRKDLRAAFDIYASGGLKGYFDWFLGGDAAAQGVDKRSLAAAEKLRARAAAPCPAAPSLQVPPWPRVSAEVFAEDSGTSLDQLASDIIVEVSGSRVRLPRQLALLWERRRDLQQAFDVKVPQGFQSFLRWALTRGIADGAVDVTALSAEFMAGFRQISRISELYRDVPITEGMILSLNVGSFRDQVPGWERFPVERSGRLAHGLWFALLAPKRFGWPASFVEPVRDYFQQRTSITVSGFALSRAGLALWELRPDLQRTFPLGDRLSVWRYVRWLVLDGLPELDLTISEFDPQLLEFLLRDSPSFEGVPQLLEMLHDFRADLQGQFDLASAEGRRSLLAWAKWDAGKPTRSDVRKQSSLAVTARFDVRDPATAAALGDRLVKTLGDAETARPSDLRTPSTVTQLHRATVALSGYWSAPSGRGEDLRGSARALDAVGCTDYVVVDFETKAVLLPDGTRLAGEVEVQVDLNVVHTNADTSVEDAQLLRRLRMRAAKTIGFWAWELEWLPDYWRHAYSFYDEIWASTKFAYEAFKRDAPRPVKLVPMAVMGPSHVEVQLSRTDLGLPQSATVFLCMFDFRSFASRKNPEAVVKAFLEAFPAGDEPVYLLFKTSGAAANPADWERLRDLAADSRIEIRDVKLERPQLLNLVRLADAFVSLHRSEGFGRGPAEAMLQGVPVIVTDYSGSADYATVDCALLVDYDLKLVGESEYPGAQGQRWAEANIASAARHLRWVHQNPRKARALGKRGRDRIRRLYSTEAVGEGMLQALGIAADPIEDDGLIFSKDFALPSG